MAKSKFIHVRVDPDHYRRINQTAVREGVSVSELIRGRVLDADEENQKRKEVQHA